MCKSYKNMNRTTFLLKPLLLIVLGWLMDDALIYAAVQHSLCWVLTYLCDLLVTHSIDKKIVFRSLCCFENNVVRSWSWWITSSIPIYYLQQHTYLRSASLSCRSSPPILLYGIHADARCRYVMLYCYTTLCGSDLGYVCCVCKEGKERIRMIVQKSLFCNKNQNPIRAVAEDFDDQ